MAENVIELNGSRYDAITGAYLGESRTKPAVATRRSRGGAIDGFIRPTATNTEVAPTKPLKSARIMNDVIKAPVRKNKSKPAPTAVTAVERATPDAIVTPEAPADIPAPVKPERKPATSARAHHPERAKTLMRRAVHKPAVNKKPLIRPQAPAEIAAPDVSAITVKRSALQVDTARLERSQAVKKHTGIRRFLPSKPTYTPAAHAATPHRTPTHVPVIAVKPAPAKHHATHPKLHDDIFEAAIAHAESHKQPHHNQSRKSKGRRLTNVMAGVGAFLVIGGFVTYLNLPNIQLHVASIQAGFKADLPSYHPTGYALEGGVKRSGNTVSMTFQSGENQFRITQQPSDWNSQTLLENTLALGGDKHKTVEAAGRTVYIYEGTNAAWVNGGVRYDLTGNAPLTPKDIATIASSL